MRIFVKNMENVDEINGPVSLVGGEGEFRSLILTHIVISNLTVL